MRGHVVAAAEFQPAVEAARHALARHDEPRRFVRGGIVVNHAVAELDRRESIGGRSEFARFRSHDQFVGSARDVAARALIDGNGKRAVLGGKSVVGACDNRIGFALSDEFVPVDIRGVFRPVKDDFAFVLCSRQQRLVDIAIDFYFS